MGSLLGYTTGHVGIVRTRAVVGSKGVKRSGRGGGGILEGTHDIRNCGDILLVGEQFEVVIRH